MVSPAFAQGLRLPATHIVYTYTACTYRGDEYGPSDGTGLLAGEEPLAEPGVAPRHHTQRCTTAHTHTEARLLRYRTSLVHAYVVMCIYTSSIMCTYIHILSIICMHTYVCTSGEECEFAEESMQSAIPVEPQLHREKTQRKGHTENKQRRRKKRRTNVLSWTPRDMKEIKVDLARTSLYSHTVDMAHVSPHLVEVEGYEHLCPGRNVGRRIAPQHRQAHPTVRGLEVRLAGVDLGAGTDTERCTDTSIYILCMEGHVYITFSIMYIINLKHLSSIWSLNDLSLRTLFW